MNLINRILFAVYKKVFLLMGKLMNRQENIIIFESFLGKQYSDNPRAIYEYLKEKHPNYKMYWSIDKTAIDKFEELNIKYVRRLSLKWLLIMNSAKYWISNSRLPLWIPKPSGTIYVQTWHGTPLKRLAFDMENVYMPGTNTVQYKKNFMFEAKKWDYLISPNNYSTEIFKSAFQYEKTILETGYPRNDFIIKNNNPSKVIKIKKALNIPVEKKVILYTPTWRDNEYYDIGKYKFALEMDLKLLEKKLSDEYVIVLRLHYLVANNIDLSNYNKFVYNMSNHTDIRELYLISDILITDYSSTFFDYANLRRPIIFFVYDIEEYRDKIRGFYLDFEKEAPGPLVKTTEEIIKEIKRTESDVLDDKDLEKFYNKYCYLEDGYATARVVQHIFKE